MARRRTSRKKQKRSSSKRGFNLLNTAELYVQTSILSESLMGVTPLVFLTGKTTSSANQSTAASAAWQNTYNPSRDGTMITLPELLGVNAGKLAVPFGGFGQGLGIQMQNNLTTYGGLGKVAVNTIMVKVGFTVAKKLLRKQRTVLNNGIKMLGLKGTVSV